MDKFPVTLEMEERAALEQLVSKGKSASQKLAHARILLLAVTASCGDHTDEELTLAVGVSPRTIGRVRKRFHWTFTLAVSRWKRHKLYSSIEV